MVSKPASTARAGGRGKVGDHALDLLLGHGRRRGIAVEGDAARPDRDPAAVGRRHGARLAGKRPIRGCLAAGVGQLGADLRSGGAMAVHEGDDPFPACSLLIGVHAGIQRADPAGRIHGRRLGEDQRRSAGCEGAQMHQVPVVRDAFAGLGVDSCTGTSATPSRGAQGRGTAAPAA